MSRHSDPSRSGTGTRNPTANTHEEVNRGGEKESSAPANIIDRSPARISTCIAIGYAVLAVVLLPTAVALVVGTVGTVLVSSSAVLGSRSGLNYGFLLLLCGVTIAGVQGSAPEPLILCTLFVILAWDSGHYGIRIGSQLGRDAATVQIELAHATLNTAIGAAGAGFGYATYRMIADGQPVVALVLFCFGAVLLIITSFSNGNIR